MNYLIAKAGLEDRITCDSAGTSNYHIGSSPDPRMAVAARRRGLQLLGRARQFQVSDFETFDLILVMDRENYWDVLAFDQERKYRDKVQMICDFARHHQDREVPDPYYGGQAGFDYVIDLLLDACEGLLEQIIESQQFNFETPPDQSESHSRQITGGNSI